LRLLGITIPQFHWRLHAYVLMTNHYHLLVETIEPTLSRGMQKIGGEYAAWFNKRHRRVGHLFQGRFKAHLIDSDEYLLQVARYIVLNPVRAHIVESAIEWPWSSARAMTGVGLVPPWLTTKAILDRFDPREAQAAQSLYRGFINDLSSAKSPWRNLSKQVYLGSTAFIDRVESRIDEQRCATEHMAARRLTTIEVIRRTVEAAIGQSLVKSSSPQARLVYAKLAYSEALALLRAIGATLGVGKTAAAYLVRRAKQLAERDAAFADLLERLRLKIRNCTLNG
jgi:REP element-mobilizing transposase RayT